MGKTKKIVLIASLAIAVTSIGLIIFGELSKSETWAMTLVFVAMLLNALSMLLSIRDKNR